MEHRAEFALSSPLLFLILFTFILGVVYKMTGWGRHVLAIGGNEQAALLTGVPVNRVKVQVYVLSGLSAAFAAISVRWLAGSAINALGATYELLAISAAVIGGANLMGGEAKRLWRVHRRGADLHHPQFTSDGRRRLELAGHVRRLVLDWSGLPRETRGAKRE